MYMNCGEITITSRTGSYISGKKLLITNILPTDVKFPEDFSYDFGKDLFEAMPVVKAQPSDRKNPLQSNTGNHDGPKKESNNSQSNYQQQLTIISQGDSQPNAQNPGTPQPGAQKLANPDPSSQNPANQSSINIYKSESVCL
ncbi:hypothetical protein DSO57_1000319 [Entomophthora muscae]|uniref:Uncharacterized protein n=1 Tax=Entomophthora muscae TaxID=34485 RepID=A0ACC2TKB1_9FUNG|nr:hypothetical protein DSO57_1000319 [Entomophthora muscae]